MNTFTIRKKELGPLVVSTPVTIIDHDGREMLIEKSPPGKDGISLCGCGRSQRMPFCDGSHKFSPSA